jgi:hypothetical protein
VVGSSVATSKFFAKSSSGKAAGIEPPFCSKPGEGACATIIPNRGGCWLAASS